MSRELYEVWSVDEEGYEDLIDTTYSLKEARSLAQQNLDQTDCVEVILFQESNGELSEFERHKRLTA